MAADDRFSKSVIATLAKRAANRCSNPNCGAITSGPAAAPTDSVNVGEAAHIYGANPGSARYDADMASADRSSITNAIWLCGNCHKLIDDDCTTYSDGVLLEWKRNHEQWVAEQVGKAARETSGGGAGGNAEIIGSDGEAYGGNGGDGGGAFGPGGNGGNARIMGGRGKAVGGNGGHGR